MIHVKFKNLKRSDMVRESARLRLEPLIEKFPDLNQSQILVTFEMENSPIQAGPDHFKVKVHVSRGRYKGVTVVKSATNLYAALADVIDHMLEVLNRYGDRLRVKERRQARALAREIDLRREDDLPFRKSS